MSKTNDAERISEICKILSKEIPNPESELNYKSPYTFLLAVIMSAQTTDVQVNKVTETLFEHYDTIDKILALGENGLAEKISSIGLYRNKARNIIALSKVLQDQYNGEVPLTREALEKLPGVGRKSANVVLNTLCGLPTIAVDTHVLRLSKRLGFSQHNDPKKVEQDLEKIIPDNYKHSISNLLVLHGRYVCKARTPNCDKCAIKNLCPDCEERKCQST